MKTLKVRSLASAFTVSAGTIGLAAALSMAVPASAQAATSYIGSAQLELTITAITGGSDTSLLIISGGSDGFYKSGTLTGGGLYDADADASPNAGTSLVVADSVTVKASASGSTGPSGGSASSSGTANALIDIFNASLDETFTVDFSYSYQQTVNASIMNPAKESATASSILEILQDSMPPGTSVFTSFIFASDGASDEPVDQTGTFSLIFGPGESDTLRLYAESQGSTAVVPVPPAAALLLSGLAVLGVPGIRRRFRT